MDQRKRRKELRSGYTTGACAAASAKAATLALLHQTEIQEVTIWLPAGKYATFQLHQCRFTRDKAICSVIKDAGDDPDCTHGAEICATVSFTKEKGLTLEGGEGVGVVTKPGLGLEIGKAAINPVPRQMITASVQEAMEEKRYSGGLKVVISVPGGEKMAKKTLNARLGILGGISILGTTGIVIPYSTAAYKASISQGLDVALAAGCEEIVLTPGGQSEKFARRLFSAIPEVAFIQTGDFVGFTLEECVKKGVKKAYFVGLIGKLSKIASGKMYTHRSKSDVDLNLLATWAKECGALEKIVQEIRTANTARHVLEIVERFPIERFFEKICQSAWEYCSTHISNQLNLHCFLTSFEGKLLGEYPHL